MILFNHVLQRNLLGLGSILAPELFLGGLGSLGLRQTQAVMMYLFRLSLCEA